MSDFDFDSYMLELVDLFICLERTLGEYYGACALKLPEHQLTWDLLIDEEEKHAKMFEAIKESLKKDSSSWKRGKFRPQAVKLIIDDVKKKMHEFLGGKIVVKYALNFIADTENSLLESCISEAFISTDPKLQAQVNKIQFETRNHRKLLHDLIQDYFK